MDIQIPDFSKAKVLVVGDVMLDRYFYSDTNRISPEAPIPVCKVKQKEDRLGGAGNVAFNIVTLCAYVKLLGIMGTDSSTEKLIECLASAKIDYHLEQDPDAMTVTKIRVVSQHQQLLRLDFENYFQKKYREQLLTEFEKILPKFNAVIISDYGKGSMLNPQQFIRAAKAKNIPVFVDPKSTDYEVYRGATVITPNRKEFESVVGVCHSEEELVEKAHQLIGKYDLGALLITRGSEGMTLIRDNEPEIHIPTQAKEVFDVTGAGDTVISVLATSIAAGENLVNSVKLANLAAGITVSKLGAAAVSEMELLLAADNTQFGGVLNEDQLVLAVKKAHARGEKVVMTNGCFDILHAGHVQYLEQAKKLGDRLIVAVNDDDSVRRLKGEDRPINNVERRMAVLAGLGAVDWVVPFSEDTPERLICKILPDILVKGGDYKDINEIAGSKCVINNGGEVKLLDFLEGCSTSAVIEKMKEDK